MTLNGKPEKHMDKIMNEFLFNSDYSQKGASWELAFVIKFF